MEAHHYETLRKQQSLDRKQRRAPDTKEAKVENKPLRDFEKVIDLFTID